MNKTPEQEAEELIEQHQAQIKEYPSEIYPDNIEYQQAKQCALITVDLVLKALPMYTGNLNSKWEHYQKVRAAIEAKT